MRLFNTPAGEVHGLRFSPDGRSLYLLSNEIYEPLRLLIESSQGLPGLPPPADALGLPLLPDAQRWLGRLFQHAYRVDTVSGEVTGKWKLRGSDDALFAPDLRSVYHSVSVAVSGGDFDLRRTDLLTGTDQRIRDLRVRGLDQLSFTPNGHILAAGGPGEFVHRLDVWHNAELEPVRAEAECLAYSPDGRLLATGGRKSVCVWDGRKLVAQWPEAAWRIAWTQDGCVVWVNEGIMSIAHPKDPAPRTWDKVTARGYSRALAVSDCGRFVATGGAQRSCSLYDLATGSARGTFDWGIGDVHSVCFAPDGLTCATGGENGQIVVWDVDE